MRIGLDDEWLKLAVEDKSRDVQDGLTRISGGYFQCSVARDSPLTRRKSILFSNFALELGCAALNA